MSSSLWKAYGGAWTSSKEGIPLRLRGSSLGLFFSSSFSNSALLAASYLRHLYSVSAVVAMLATTCIVHTTWSWSLLAIYMVTKY